MHKKDILHNLISNTIDWIDTISSLQCQSDEKVLQLNEQDIVQHTKKCEKIRDVQHVK